MGMRSFAPYARSRLIVLAVVVASSLQTAVAPQFWAEPVPEHEVVTLWQVGAPGAKGNDPTLDMPTLNVWRPKPDVATGASVIICPGGGYEMLALDHEGRQVAEWLNTLGVTAFVLKYRLAPRYHYPAMLQDATRAIRMVRASARRWNLDPHRVAILGFSAGGHLASTVGTHFDAGKADAEDPIERESSRPDRMILVYPVIALDPPFGHSSTKRNLLGQSPPETLVHSLSNQTQVTSETPPTFLAHTSEDTGVPAENSLLFALALRKCKVPVEMHLFEKGEHGMGMGNGAREYGIAGEPAFQQWPKLCAVWLKNQRFLDRAGTLTAAQKPAS